MRQLTIIIIGFLLAIRCMAATHYVVTNGTPGVISTDPYTNWATAGTNIPDVVTAALTNTGTIVVWVSNGTYEITSPIHVTQSLTIQSVNGRDNTILMGKDYPLGSNRCFEVDAAATANIIDGFTITNFSVQNPGSQRGTSRIYGTIRNCAIVDNSVRSWGNYNAGGGLWLLSDSICSNCIVSGNLAGGLAGGGGIWVQGDNVKIVDCRIEANLCGSYGGGLSVYEVANCIISNCYILNNRAAQGAGLFVGIGSATTNCIIDSCTITGNVATGNNNTGPGNGGGIYLVPWYKLGALVLNSRITGNSCNGTAAEGGGIYGKDFRMRNCLVANNAALINGGGIWCSNTGLVENCTIVSNDAGVAGGGLYIVTSGSGTNNIIYFNTVAGSANNFVNTAGNTGLDYSCVIPAVAGTGNTTNDPNLVGGYRLSANSPCVNTGRNQDWMTNAFDLDGNKRIFQMIVDMGAYEFRRSSTVFSFR